MHEMKDIATDSVGIGVMLVGPEDPIDSVLSAVCDQLSDEGCQIKGFVQSETCSQNGVSADTFLHAATGNFSRKVSLDLGCGSTACSVDAGVIAEMAGQLLEEIDRDTDLLIINRFGRCESLGGGLRPVIDAAVVRNIPVLTAVRQRYWRDWDDYSSGMADALPASVDAVVDWCRQSVRRPGAHPVPDQMRQLHALPAGAGCE